MTDLATRPGPRPQPLPRLSIVIDNYRYEQFVARTIESALAQTVADRVEVIVIDDGSPDDSMAVINRYADRVQVIAKPNGGQASAYNLGLRQAMRSILRWPRMNWSRRLATLVWMLGVLVLPRPQAHQLALIHRRSAGVPTPPSAHCAAARLAAVKSRS